MTAPTLLKPNTDLVAVTWARRVPKLTSRSVPVATSLPAQITVSHRETGFVVARGVGGTPDVYVPMRHPVVTFECWVPPASEGSSKVPWGHAAQLAEWLWEATYGLSVDGVRMQQVKLSLPLPGYEQVRIFTVNALAEPRRVEGDPGNFARFDQDVEITWTGVGA